METRTLVKQFFQETCRKPGALSYKHFVLTHLVFTTGKVEQFQEPSGFFSSSPAFCVGVWNHLFWGYTAGREEGAAAFVIRVFSSFCYAYFRSYRVTLFTNLSLQWSVWVYLVRQVFSIIYPHHTETFPSHFCTIWDTCSLLTHHKFIFLSYCWFI